MPSWSSLRFKILSNVGRSRGSGSICVSGSGTVSDKLSDSPLDSVSDDISDISAQDDCG